MIKKSLQTLLSAAVLVGCAADSSQPGPTQASPVPSPGESALGTAFFGLTVKDCSATAADCFQNITDPATQANEAGSCQDELRACFGDVVQEAATTVEQGATEIVQCGRDGLTCYADAHEFDAIVACHESVEACVNGTVKDATGIELPTTKQILDAAVQLPEAVGTVHAEATESATGTAATATEVAEGAVEDAVSAAIDAASAVVMSAQSLLDCAVDGHFCMLETADFVACSDAYQTCVTAIP